MIDIIVQIDETQDNAIKNLCSVSGSHLTFLVLDKQFIAAAISPEYFKLYRFPGTYDIEDFSIRVAKKLVRPAITAGTNLRITIDSNVTFRKYFFDNQRAPFSMQVPLEQDYNDDLVRTVISAGAKVNAECDLAAVTSLRSVVNFAQNGLQVKNGLAYAQGAGFVVYSKIDSPFDFIMTQANVAELSTFIRTYRTVNMYECGAYAVFRHNGNYFGCRLPVHFVESEYEEYCNAEPICETEVELGSLTLALQSLTIPKNETTSCVFHLADNNVSIDMGMLCHYDISIHCQTASDLEFSLPLDILKKLFSNSKINFSNGRMRVFDSFVALCAQGVDMLISKE